MLAKKNRAPLKKDFLKIRSAGKNYDSPSFGLLVSYNNSQTLPQAAFVISKKIDKRSVVRHDVKRKLADGVAPFFPRLPKNLELVFLAKQKAIESTREELKVEIEVVLHRARLLQAS